MYYFLVILLPNALIKDFSYFFVSQLEAENTVSLYRLPGLSFKGPYGVRR